MRLTVDEARKTMKPRNWLLTAFVLAALVGVSAMWMADIQNKRMAAEQSMTGIKAALTPFERDRRSALEKAKHLGIDPRWVEGER